MTAKTPVASAGPIQDQSFVAGQGQNGHEAADSPATRYGHEASPARGHRAMARSAKGNLAKSDPAVQPVKRRAKARLQTAAHDTAARVASVPGPAAAAIEVAVTRRKKSEKPGKRAATSQMTSAAASMENSPASHAVAPALTWRPMRKSVGWALTVLARLHRAELGERLAQLGLFPGQEQLLQALHDNGSMTMGALADAMQVRPPTASKAVVRLTSQGLVERSETEGGDARVVRVQLTAQGHERAAQIAAIWWDAERRLIDGFDGGARKKLRKALRTAAGNFSSPAIADAAVVVPDAQSPAAKIR